MANTTFVDGVTPITAAWLNDVNRKTYVEEVSVKDFGAVGDGVADDTTAIQNALNQVAINGGVINFPPGTFKVTSSLNIYKNTIVKGAGRHVSAINYTGTGDCVKSTWPINSSTAVWSGLRDIALVCTNASNAGGGFVDVGGTYIDLYNCYITGFKYQVILDQTEISTILNCEFTSGVGAVGIWLVNGPAHTVGASLGFTNRISICYCQFNSAVGSGAQIIDDGGNSHLIQGNNFNAGQSALVAAGTSNLQFISNEVEGHATPLVFSNLSSTGANVDFNYSPRISDNAISDVCTVHIRLDGVVGGEITNNMFGQATSSSILLPNGLANNVVGTEIRGNTKIVTGPWKQAAPFINGWTVPMNRLKVDQTASTYSTAAAVVGLNTITPASMEFISAGGEYFCVNSDGTNGETIVPSSSSSTTFTANFGSIKNANFVIHGISAATLITTNFTPLISGSTSAGVGTYTLQYGRYQKIGTRIYISVAISWSAHSGTGNLMITGLPFIAKAITFGDILNIATSGINCGVGMIPGAVLNPGTTTINIMAMSTSGAVNINVPVVNAAGIQVSGFYEI